MLHRTQCKSRSRCQEVRVKRYVRSREVVCGMERQEKHCSLMLENWWLGIDESSMIMRMSFLFHIYLVNYTSSHECER